jgi:hypothetical protein
MPALPITKLPVLARFLSSNEACDQVDAFLIARNDLLKSGRKLDDLPQKLNEALSAASMLGYLLNGGNGFVNISENSGADTVSLNLAVELYAEMGLTNVATHLAPYAKRYDLAKGDLSVLELIWGEFSNRDRKGLEADPIFAEHKKDATLAAYLRKSVDHEGLDDQAYHSRIKSLSGDPDAVHAVHRDALRGFRIVPATIAEVYIRQTGLKIATAPKTESYMVRDGRGTYSGVGQSIVINHDRGADKFSLEILRFAVFRIDQVDPHSDRVIARRHTFWLPTRPRWLTLLVMRAVSTRFRA